MPSTTHDTAYTALEQLLLFHNLGSAHPIQGSTFVDVSNALLKHPVVRADETFDRGRLSPDALREQYTWLLREYGKTGNMGGISAVEAEMYDEYKKGVFKAIREEERRFVAAQKEIREIEEGRWDERLAKEWEMARRRSRSVSTATRRAATGSPALEKQMVVGSPRPEKDKLDKTEQAKEAEQDGRKKDGVVSPPTVSETAGEKTSIIAQAAAEVISNNNQQNQEKIAAKASQGDLTAAPLEENFQQPPSSIGLGLSSIPPSIPSAPVSAIRGEPAPAPGPHARMPQSPQVLNPAAPASMHAFPNAPTLSPPKGSNIPVPASPSHSIPPTPTQLATNSGPTIPRTHQLSPHRQDSGSPRPPQHQLQPQTSPIRRQAVPPPIAIQSQQAGWQQQIMRPSQSPSQISPPLPSVQAHYTPGPHPQPSHSQIPVAGHPFSPAPQHGARTPGGPVGGYFAHSPAAQTASPVMQHPQQQFVRAAGPPYPGAPYSPSPYGVYQQHMHRSPAPFAHTPGLPSGPTTPMQSSPRRTHPPLEAGQPFTPVPAGYPLPNPGSPRQPGPEDISPISTPPSSPRPERTPPLASVMIEEKARSNKRPLDESSDEKKATLAKDQNPPAKRQRSIKGQRPAEASPANPAGPGSSAPAESSTAGISEAVTPTPGRGRGKAQSILKTASTRGRPRGRGKATGPTPGRETGTPGSTATSARTSPEKTEVPTPRPDRFSKAASTEPEDTASPPTTAKRRSAPIAKANWGASTAERIPSTPASPLKRRRSPSPGRRFIDGDATDEDDDLPSFHQMLDDQSPKKTDPRRMNLKKQPPPRPAPISTASGSSIGGASPAGTNAPLHVVVGQQPMVVATKKFTTLTAPLLANISGHRFANLFSAPVVESRAPGYREMIRRPQDLKSIKGAIRAGTTFVQSLDTNPSTAATPTRSTPPVFPSAPSISAPTIPTSSTATSITMPATTLNTPPKGIVNSLQLEKELFRMFANAVMYNKTNTEIVKETNIMAKDVEAMVNNFRGAEEVGTRKALAAKEKEGPQWGGRRNLFQREETGEREKERTESVTGERDTERDGEKGGAEEDEEEDRKSEAATVTEEQVQVPRKRGRPKRRKEEEETDG